MLTGTRQQSLEIMYELTKYWVGGIGILSKVGGGGGYSLGASDGNVYLSKVRGKKTCTLRGKFRLESKLTTNLRANI